MVENRGFELLPNSCLEIRVHYVRFAYRAPARKAASSEREGMAS